MNKNDFAQKPPMGWNSWDCYGAAVNEEQLLGNAEYMAKNLKQFGWQYVVCDIQWYEPNAKDNDYNNFTELCMDDYSRLIPAENRFPSSKNGAGFKPIADKIHAMGLKFGIHIMRGIPRQAVHRNTKIFGSDKTARQIAHHFSVCPWNTDMYGVDARQDGAQEYYDSLFSLYASWGVDFVKVDDICVTEFRKWDNPYSASDEVEMIRKAIDKTGREIVLSLSPGPAEKSVADHLCENANMWRLTGDFWDSWEQLYGMFDRCKLWEDVVSEGCWPDCDMLPLGRISKNGTCHGEQNRYTKFTPDEQKTLMTLWCIFRSPLMFGGEMRENDELTLSLITNPEILAVNQTSHGGKEIYRDEDFIIRKAYDEEDNVIFAVFNVSDTEKTFNLDLHKFGFDTGKTLRDLWKRVDIGETKSTMNFKVPSHGAELYRIY